MFSNADFTSLVLYSSNMFHQNAIKGSCDWLFLWHFWQNFMTWVEWRTYPLSRMGKKPETQRYCVWTGLYRARVGKSVCENHFCSDQFMKPSDKGELMLNFLSSKLPDLFYEVELTLNEGWLAFIYGFLLKFSISCSCNLALINHLIDQLMKID